MAESAEDLIKAIEAQRSSSEVNSLIAEVDQGLKADPRARFRKVLDIGDYSKELGDYADFSNIPEKKSKESLQAFMAALRKAKDGEEFTHDGERILRISPTEFRRPDQEEADYKSSLPADTTLGQIGDAVMGNTKAFEAGAQQNLAPSMVGIGAASAVNQFLPAGTPWGIRAIAGGVVGAGAALGSSILQRKATEAVAPEFQAAQDKAIAEHEIAGKLGSLAAGGFLPGGITGSLRDELLSRAVPAGIGGGISVAQDYLTNGGSLPEGTAKRALESAAIQAIFNKPMAHAAYVEELGAGMGAATKAGLKGLVGRADTATGAGANQSAINEVTGSKPPTMADLAEINQGTPTGQAVGSPEMPFDIETPPAMAGIAKQTPKKFRTPIIEQIESDLGIGKKVGIPRDRLVEKDQAAIEADQRNGLEAAHDAVQKAINPILGVSDKPTIEAKKTILADLLAKEPTENYAGSKLTGDPTLGELIGQNIRYAGYDGKLIRDPDGGFSLVQKGLGPIVEVSGTGKDINTKASDVGIKFLGIKPGGVTLGALDPLLGYGAGKLAAWASGQDEETQKKWADNGLALGLAAYGVSHLTSNPNLLRAAADAFKGRDFVTQTEKELRMSDKPFGISKNREGEISTEQLKIAISKLNKPEQAALNEAGIGKLTEGVKSISPEVLANHLKDNWPQVVVKDYTNNEVHPTVAAYQKASAEYDALPLALKSLQYEYETRISRGMGAEEAFTSAKKRLEDFTSPRNAKEFNALTIDDVIHASNLAKAEIKAEKAMAHFFLTPEGIEWKSRPRITDYYKSMAPHDLESHPIQRVDVIKPSPSSENTWKPDKIHEQLKDTIGWSAIQYHIDNLGRKIANLFEIQSNWKAKRNEAIKQLTDDHDNLMLNRKFDADQFAAHGEERAVMWINRAIERDPALYEKYHEVVTSNESTKQDYRELADAILKNEAEFNKAGLERQIARFPGTWALDDVYRTILKAAIAKAGANGATHIMIPDPVTSAMTQGHLSPNYEPGQDYGRMGGHESFYGKQYRQIAEELTGSKGEDVDLGQHRVTVESPLNDGSDPVTVRNSGRLYPIEGVTQKLAKEGPFTMTGKRGSIDPAAMMGFAANQGAGAIGAAIGYSLPAGNDDEKKRNAIIGYLLASGGHLTGKAMQAALRSNPQLVQKINEAAYKAAKDPQGRLKWDDYLSAHAPVPPQDGIPALVENINKDGLDVMLQQTAPSIDLADPSPNRMYTPFLSKLPLFGPLARLAIGTNEGNIASRNQRVFGDVRNYQEDIFRHSAHWSTGTYPFTQEFLSARRNGSMSVDEYKNFNYAMWRGELAEARSILEANPNLAKLTAGFDKAVETYHGPMRDAITASGRDLAELPEGVEAWPRQVADLKGLRKALGSKDQLTLDETLRKAAASKRRPLSDAEEGFITSEFIRRNAASANAQIGGLNAPKPGFIKERSVYGLTSDEVLRYYEPWYVAMDNRIQKVAHDVAKRTALGRNSPEDSNNWDGETGSIGQGIAEELAAGRINHEDKEFIIKNVKSMMNHVQGRAGELVKFGSWLNRAQNVMMLGHPDAAIAQFGDIGFTILRQGGINTAKAYASMLSEKMGGQEGVHLKDLAIGKETFAEMQQYSVAPENRGIGGFGKRSANQLTGMFAGWADLFNKTATVRAARLNLISAMENPTSATFARFQKKYSERFPGRWEEIRKSLTSEDFKKGKLDDNTMMVLFNELADAQPIASGQRAQLETSVPELAYFYGLKRFMIKQLDVLRQEGYEKMKHAETFAEGLGFIAKYMTVAAATGAAVSAIRDVIFGREINFEEGALSGILQLVGINYFQIKNFREGHFGDALASTFMPIAGPANALYHDYKVATQYGLDGLQYGINELPEKSRSIMYLPVVGREMYYWYGAGDQAKVKNAQLEAKRAASGDDLPPTLSELSKLIAPPLPKKR